MPRLPPHRNKRLSPTATAVAFARPSSGLSAISCHVAVPFAFSLGPAAPVPPPLWTAGARSPPLPPHAPAIAPATTTAGTSIAPTIRRFIALPPPCVAAPPPTSVLVRRLR